jgi:hypothetical protein
MFRTFENAEPGKSTKKVNTKYHFELGKDTRTSEWQSPLYNPEFPYLHSSSLGTFNLSDRNGTIFKGIFDGKRLHIDTTTWDEAISWANKHQLQVKERKKYTTKYGKGSKYIKAHLQLYKVTFDRRRGHWDKTLATRWQGRVLLQGREEHLTFPISVDQSAHIQHVYDLHGFKAWNADGDEVKPPTLQATTRGTQKVRESGTDLDNNGGDMENYNYWQPLTRIGVKVGDTENYNYWCIGVGRKDGEKPPVLISKKVDMNLLNITLDVKGNETNDTL